MALRLSTGLRNAQMGANSYAVAGYTATTISFGDGTGTDGRDQILDSANGFVIAGLKLGDYVTVFGSTSNNVSAKKILAVTAGAIEIAAGSLSTEAAGDQVVLCAARGGGSVDELFRNGVIRIYSGSQPSTADAAETGTLLLEVTESDGAFAAGAPANGLNFDGEAAASGLLTKESSETWQGTGAADGTAGWFRFYDNAYVTGASTTAVRFDGSCATSGGQLTMSSTAIVSGVVTTLDSAAITLPASA